MTAIARNVWIAVVFVGVGLATQAFAQPPAPAAAAINGVYTGTYTCNDGTVALKLSLKSTEAGALTGLFTFELPAYFGSRPATYKLTGRYVAKNRYPFQFTTVMPVGPPAPAAYAMTGVYISMAGPDRIAGPITGKTSVSFRAARDRAESAELDAVMTTQADTATKVSAPTAAAAVARLSSIDGVYNGTFAGAQGPTKFKLTITQQGHGTLAGVLTVYLASDTGTKAYTYSLEGPNDPAHRRFELYDREWDTIPPSGFEKMGIAATFAPDPNRNTARISGVMRGAHNWPKFEATWSATESADLTGAIAAQKTAGPSRVPPPTAEDVAAHTALVAAHAAALKNAPPAQSASKGLVRKSPAYWDSFRTDLIREIFDGGFGAEVNNDTQFRIFFTSYVEMFSKQCQANLPARHETVTITFPAVTVLDNYGRVVSRREGRSWSVEVDSRFAQYYRASCESLNSRGQGLAAAVGIMTGNSSSGTYFDPALDIAKFFTIESGSSAAMHQLGENLLRGATGEPSLQEAGASIPGAAAETDPGLPPGRFSHFVDAANAFYRDPANARYRTGHDTEFCQRLALKYRNVMTSDEEYYYANDFGARFFNQIMQPQKNSTDPEWPRLHPAVEECLTETR